MILTQMISFLRGVGPAHIGVAKGTKLAGVVGQRVATETRRERQRGADRFMFLPLL
jgi:hypothetical protein